jgi:hypothetical protein
MPTTSPSAAFDFPILNCADLGFTNESETQTQDDVEKGMAAAKDAGLKVFRTWGFNDKNATYDPVGLPQYGSEGAGETEIVFQTWANGTSIINVAPFDKVVNAATKVGIKLIVALTNNWADYGGMDVYTVNLGGKYHDDVRILPRLTRCLMLIDHWSSFIVFLSLRIILNDTSGKWSLGTRTLRRSWHGSLEMNRAAAQMEFATSREVTNALPPYSPPGLKR